MRRAFDFRQLSFSARRFAAGAGNDAVLSRRVSGRIMSGVAILSAGVGVGVIAAASSAPVDCSGASVASIESDMQSLLRTVATETGVSAAQAGTHLRPLTDIDAIRNAYGIPSPEEEHDAGALPAIAHTPPHIHICRGVEHCEASGDSDQFQVVVFRGCFKVNHGTGSDAESTGGSNGTGSGNVAALRAVSVSQHREALRFVLSHLQPTYPEAVSAALMQLSGTERDVGETLTLAIPSGGLTIAVNAGGLSSSAAEVTVKWAPLTPTQLTVTRTSSSSAAVTITAQKPRQQVSYADLDAMMSLFRLSAAAYADEVWHARETEIMTSSESPYVAGGAGGRARAHARLMALREAELAVTLPRLSLLLRLNRALGGLPSHLATLLDPAHAYHHQQQQHQQQRRFTSPGSQIQTLRGTGSVPNDAAVASAPQAISTASATNSGTAEAAATAASHQTEGFTIRAVAGGGSDDDKHEGRSRDDEAEQPAALATNKGKRAKDAAADPVAVLEELGVKMYSKLSLGGAKGAMMGWESLAGHEIESNVLFPIRRPELYARVAQLTRAEPEANHHGGYIFSGPPGTGKTTAARIVASLVDKPLVVLNFENIGSAYYSEWGSGDGQSESNLQKVLDAVAAMPGAILFVDEAEAIFPSRFSSGGDVPSGGGGGGRSGSGVAGATSTKLLSQLLKFMEGIGGGASNSVILATNRPQELDPALLSRCAASVRFELPSAEQRLAIWRRYAKQLSPEDLQELAEDSEGMAGRDIKRSAELAERRHTAGLQRSGLLSSEDDVTPPPIEQYLHALEERQDGVLAMQSGAAAAAASSQQRAAATGSNRGGGGHQASPRDRGSKQQQRQAQAQAEERRGDRIRI